MLSFFYKSHRFVLSVLVVCVIISMCFFGMNNNAIPSAKDIKETVYAVGKDKNRMVDKRDIEAMKTFLSFDLGYGFNDVLQRQNIFADGLFLDLVDSSFGRGLVAEYFPFIKDDFEKRVASHKTFRFYRHPSGAFTLDALLKEQAKPFYDQVKQVMQKDREVDKSLFLDYIKLASMQRVVTPSAIHRIISNHFKFNEIMRDPTIDRRNYALFHTKNNEEMFGADFLELFAQGVLEGAAFAKDAGYCTSYEEAEGIIMRRAMAVLEIKYQGIEDYSQIYDLRMNFMQALGLPEKDLVRAGQKIITLQKMIKDIDSSVLLDKMTLAAIHNKKVENINAVIVNDHPNMTVKDKDMALEIQCYLESIGEQKGFLSAPETLYSEKDMKAGAPVLFAKGYRLKIAKKTKSEVAQTFPLKKAWDFQTSDDGWALLKKKYLFEDKSKDTRFAFLQGLNEQKKKAVLDYSLKTLLSFDESLIDVALANERLKAKEFLYNGYVTSGVFDKEFDEQAFVKLLDEKEVGDTFNYHSLDGEHFYRIHLMEKKGESLLDFNLAKNDGYLTYLVDMKLKALNRGREFNDDRRKTLVDALLKKEGGSDVYHAISEAEKNKLYYSNHSKDRLQQFKQSEERNLPDLLKQFAIQKKQDVIARVGNSRILFSEEYLTMKENEISDIHSSLDGSAFYIHFISKNIDEDKLMSYRDEVHKSIAREIRDEFYTSLVSHIIDNKMIEMSRFEKEDTL